MWFALGRGATCVGVLFMLKEYLWCLRGWGWVYNQCIDDILLGVCVWVPMCGCDVACRRDSCLYVGRSGRTCVERGFVLSGNLVYLYCLCK